MGKKILAELQAFRPKEGDQVLERTPIVSSIGMAADTIEECTRRLQADVAALKNGEQEIEKFFEDVIRQSHMIEDACRTIKDVEMKNRGER